MKYQSEIIKNLIENNGHHVTTNPHYEVECINEIINDVRGSYPKLCDYMGEWMNYANEHMGIGKFPTERVTDVTNARFDNVVPYGYKSAILKGLTLVNIATKHDGGYNGSGEVLMTPTLLKANTKYYIKVIDDEFNLNRASFRTKDWTDRWYYATNGVVILTTPTQDEFNNYMYLTFIVTKNGEQVEIDNTIRDRLKWIICEYQEDMENWNIHYFEGMQSVKMPVLTTSNSTIKVEEFILGGTDSNGNITINESGDNLTNFIKVSSNTKYTIKFNNFNKLSSIVVNYYDENRNFIIRTINPANNVLTTPSNCEFVVIRFYSNPKLIGSIELYLTDNGYEPYKSNILTTPEDLELRGIGDVKDELNLLTGELIQRASEFIIDKNTSITKYQDIEGFNTTGYYVNLPSNFDPNTTDFICNSLPKSGPFQIQPNMTPVDKEGIAVNAGYIKFRVSNEKGTNVEDFKEYLEINPIKLIIPLAEKSIKTVDLSCLDENNNPTKFKPYEGVMYVETSSETLPPLLDMEVPVEAITQNLMGFIN